MDQALLRSKGLENRCCLRLVRLEQPGLAYQFNEAELFGPSCAACLKPVEGLSFAKPLKTCSQSTVRIIKLLARFVGPRLQYCLKQ
jgi:hypothetical protein